MSDKVSVSSAMLADGLILLLSLVGSLISIYFTLVYYQVIPANYYLVPRMCRMNEATCQTVLSARDAKVFGFPNSALGFLYYTIVFFITLIGGWENNRFVHWVFLLISILVVLLTVYLSYSLLYKIKIVCPLCFVSHGINVAIALLLFIKT
jgi:uncharacterized membrane protein